MQIRTQLDHWTKTSWLQFLEILLILFFCFPLINSAFTILPIWLYEQANQNTNAPLLESLKNISYEFVALLFLVLYTMKYKPLRQLVLPAVDFQCLKTFRMYIYVLIYYVIGAFIDFFILDKLFPEPLQEQLDVLDFATLEHYKFLLVLAVGIIAPIYEELVCRGLLLRFFEEKFTFWPAALLSSLLFGIAHTYSVGVMVSTFITGLFAALLYKQTKSIIPAMLLHIIINTSSFFY
ncbi:CPBP family intramembrane glutamic endopeptidase [Bacillus pseudomycoides]|uniref:CPBP family intramembrane glutamic endopeptidase n=1 Tax=Bacillus pseudomycoides TaxID=64104 RepID=UPI000BEDB4B5|nr:CPBP family intramembrane glutamic endopeptidase [Bacillus pseudomycoides]PED07047.1 CPBP family intramembrane metalloprotease [Bacillus pseudomycoides]PEI86997.1 CPBP family intramembrane metalloprotease [Bacillus pseudomycoides]PEK27156.1 CPBP family intramembrane metalloprotease [Bacillus pseudomycoides]PEM71220.1 CPBP family intramembrane metalloprotease [Bacillus pseudomycoides]PEO22084.1 CPBP family intramembrane metalloprotease [Bacillus pseudomycoides]